MKQINQQEELVRSVIRKSSELFPEAADFRKIDDAAIGGWANRKRKTNPKLAISDTMRFQIGANVTESPGSQKKAVRLLINDNEGNATIQTASPTESQFRKQRFKSDYIDNSFINEYEGTPQVRTINRGEKEEIFGEMKFPQIDVKSDNNTVNPKTQTKDMKARKPGQVRNSLYAHSFCQGGKQAARLK